MARAGQKIIISCAITGAVHTPTMSEFLPVTPDEIASQAIGAAEAGAAILHLHARDPQTGRPTQHRRPHFQEHFSRHRARIIRKLGDEHGTRFEHEGRRPGRVLTLEHQPENALGESPRHGFGAALKTQTYHPPDQPPLPAAQSRAAGSA